MINIRAVWKEESVQNLLYDCPTLQVCRLKCLCSRNFYYLERLNDVSVIRHLKSIKIMGWFR